MQSIYQYFEQIIKENGTNDFAGFLKDWNVDEFIAKLKL